MINSRVFSSVLTVLLVFFTSCKTYEISVDSFKRQFAGMKSLGSKEVTMQGPVGERRNYKTYAVDYIKVVDKQGNSVDLRNSPSIEIRLTDTTGKKTVFYFDTIFFDGDYITGTQARLITPVKKSIPFNSIKKIEVQNGKKNFHYVNQ